MNNLLQVRVTGILIEDERICWSNRAFRQNVAGFGGRVERETLEEAMVREMVETGLTTKVKKLCTYVINQIHRPPVLERLG